MWENQTKKILGLERGGALWGTCGACVVEISNDGESSFIMLVKCRCFADSFSFLVE